MTKVIAIGKWSKTFKRWHTVVALRQSPQKAPTGRPPTRPTPRPNRAD